MQQQNVIVISSANTLYILLVCIIVSLIVLYVEVLSRLQNGSKKIKSSEKLYKNLKKKAPSPRALPIIGNLASLDGYEIPYQAFNDLSEKYGPIISLKLGNVPALVVNGIENIREVLIMKTSHFDSRPNFRRYHELFAGNKENSLAFCDWSDLHKFRRDMLTPHAFPRNYSNRFKDLNATILNEIQLMLTPDEINNMNNINNNNNNNNNITSDLNEIEIKYWLLKTCGNIFVQYFCSHRFDTVDPQFDTFIRNFDKVFYEVNQGYAADFLPFLMPLHKKNLQQMEKCAHEIRAFIEDRIIEDRFETTTIEEMDYVDSFITHIKESRLPTLERDTALFALEDIIGGHSAVGNFLTKVFAFLIQNPEVQEKIKQEVDEVLINESDEWINLQHRSQMPYTQAVIMESLRLIASPIVPHVSNQDTTVNGYHVEANTLVFLNNYDLSMSPKLWVDPNEFKPERFIRDGNLIKPDYFLPFGAGRRSCMGYKLVQFISFAILGNFMKDYRILPISGENYKIQIGSLAVPENSFKIKMQPRV